MDAFPASRRARFQTGLAFIGNNAKSRGMANIPIQLDPVLSGPGANSLFDFHLKYKALQFNLLDYKKRYLPFQFE
jgi:hypothetical protein